MSRRTLKPLALAFAALAIYASAPAAAKTEAPPESNHFYGPAPAWEEYRRLAEAEVRGRLIDPESARIEWLGGFYKGKLKMFFKPATEGYIACGTVNAKNRMGGYVGASAFITVVDYDRVLYAELDGSSPGEVAMRCNQAIQGGLIPALPASDAPDTPGFISSDAAPKVKARTSSGITLRAMPEGAYVAALAPGSIAEAAGLKPGMVIVSVNGIPLAGMGDAMLAVLNAAGPGAALTMVGGATIKLGTQP